MKRSYVIIIILAALLILLAGIFGLFSMITTKYLGTEVTATVVKLPSHCSNRSKITVEYNQQEYQLAISATNCRMAVYQVGQQMPVMYHAGLNMVVSPNTGIEYVALIMLVLLIFIYFQYRSSVQKYRDKEKKLHQQRKAT